MDKYQAKLRSDTLAKFEYDGCICCGSREGLQIDHVHGKGAAHRASLGGNWTAVYRYVRDLPRGKRNAEFQVLCGKCNASKGEGPVCNLLVWAEDGALTHA